MKVPGFNVPRPTKENYDDFVEKLTSGLEALCVPELSLMLYGSYARGDYDVGRSDIDAMLIFPENNVVIDKVLFGNVASILSRALEGNPVSFQFTAADITTMLDGRFNSYALFFKDYFALDSETNVAVGPDYREKISYTLPSHPQQGGIRHNLRRVREWLLFSKHYDEAEQAHYFNKGIDKAGRVVNQLLHMVYGEEEEPKKFFVMDLLKETFPEVNVKPLEEISWLYENLDELDALYRNTPKMFRLWNDSVTLYEELIGAYIQKVPQEKPL